VRADSHTSDGRIAAVLRAKALTGLYLLHHGTVSD
jgi:hypothetical protein